MLEYLKYYLSPLTQALALWGLCMGGDHVWIAIAWFRCWRSSDSLLPIDLRHTQDDQPDDGLFAGLVVHPPGPGHLRWPGLVCGASRPERLADGRRGSRDGLAVGAAPGDFRA